VSLAVRELTIYDLNLVLQLIIFVLFLVGIYYIKAERKNLKRHRQLMGVVVVLNAISIILIMGRSLMTSLGLLTARPFQIGAIMMWVHVIAGAYAEISGVLFLRKHPPNLRLNMKVTTIFWTIALLLGVISYMYYYLL